MNLLEGAKGVEVRVGEGGWGGDRERVGRGRGEEREGGWGRERGRVGERGGWGREGGWGGREGRGEEGGRDDCYTYSNRYVQ